MFLHHASLSKPSFHTCSVYRETLVFAAEPHHDFERAVRDIFSAEPHVDDVGPWLRRGVEDVEGSILVLDDLCLHLSPVGCDHDARDFPFPCAFGVHDEAHLLSDADGGPDARACRMRIRCLVCAETMGKKTQCITLTNMLHWEFRL